MRDLGDRREDDIINFGITFYGQTGTPKDPETDPAIAFAMFKDDDDSDKTTEGIAFATHDSTNMDGLVRITLDLADTQDPRFYTPGSDYFLVLTAGEVDNVNLAGVCVATFSIVNRVTLPFVGIDGAVDTATLASSTTVFETDLTEASDDHYNDQALVWGAGATNAGLTFFITDSQGTTANTNNKVKLTVQTMPNAPADDDTFVILGTKGS